MEEGDDRSNSMNPMNLDLNLGPGDHARDIEPELGGVTMSLEEWVQRADAREEEPIYRISNALRSRARSQWRWRQRIDHWEGHVLDDLIVTSASENVLLAGEASGAPEETSNETIKACENNLIDLDDEGLRSDEEKANANADAVSFFDCNVCLELSKDPVVTCCGHLFCWSCLYRWLHVHSDANECPVCKGQVKMKNVIPIYGRRNTAREPDVDSSVKIPPRPHAQRVESLRQSLRRNAFTIPIEEMIRRLGNRFDLVSDTATPQEPDGDSTRGERSNPLLHRIMTLRGIRRELNAPESSRDVVDLTQITENSPDPEPAPSRRLPPLLLRRSQRHRTATVSSIPPAVSSADGLAETHFHSNPIRRHQEPARSVGDRDSYSSTAAVINSESLTTDNAVEIDSLVSISTSSSRRRNDNARVSDVDSGDSRPPRRRRLN